jgi:hypothetical protein
MNFFKLATCFTVIFFANSHADSHILDLSSREEPWNVRSEACEEKDVLTPDLFLEKILSCNFVIQELKETYIEKRGSMLKAYGPYDSVLGSTSSYLSDDATHETTLKGSLKKEFETGGTIEALATNTLKKSRESGKNTKTANSAETGIKVTQPLLRDMMWNANRTGLYKTCLETKGVYYSTIQSMGAEVVVSLSRYWRALQVNRELQIYRWGEKEFQSLIDKMHENPTDPNDIENVERVLRGHLNNLASKRISSIKKLKRELLNLQSSMGYLDIKRIDSLCLSEMPEVKFSYDDEEYEDILELAEDIAMRKNFKVVSSHLNEKAKLFTLKFAQNQLRPKLELATETYYRASISGTRSTTVTGTEPAVEAKSFFRPYQFRDPYIKGKVTLTFSKPLCNRSALGSLETASAAYRKNVVSRHREQTTAMISTVDAIGDFELDWKEGKKQKESLEHFKGLYSDTKEEISDGTSLKRYSWISEYLNNYINGQVDYSLTQRDLLLDILKLRQATSTIFSVEEPLDRLELNDLTAFPIFEVENSD